MKDSMFWRVISVGVVLGLFAIAYEVSLKSDLLSPFLASPVYAADAVPETPTGVLDFKSLPTSGPNIARAKVSGGWLVIFDANGDASNPDARGAGITFFPDPTHHWSGGSLK